VPVGAIRAIDVVADNPGDWTFHCHKSHHTMNAMGHNTRDFIGSNQKALTKAIRDVVPDYIPMGSSGMAEMAVMEMPMPDNALPMMTRTFSTVNIPPISIGANWPNRARAGHFRFTPQSLPNCSGSESG
jgi:hypothetical protein